MPVLDLGAYDAILGYDWLKPHSPMTCHWDNYTLEFREKEDWLNYMEFSPLHSNCLICQDTLVKVSKGNDIWAVAIVNYVEQISTSSLPEIEGLLQELEDVFSKPNSSSPQRLCDHTIPLLPNFAPVNSKPYRYSPSHKDEIERQVKELLDAGLITYSTSPFASPVLLVQKKVGNWRFCVDYRKLNDLTVKDRFPLPIIEEIIDELAGIQFLTKLDMTAGYYQIRMGE